MAADPSQIGEFTLAHGFPKGSQGAEFVGLALNICGEHSVGGAFSKMGPHMTVIPPFFRNREEMMFVASCLRAERALHSESTVEAMITGVDFFSVGGDNESLYLAIEVPKGYAEHVEWMKAAHPFKWVHWPLHDNAVEPIYVPHIHVIEGPKLKARVEPFLEKLNRVFRGRPLQLPPSCFYEKVRRGDERRYQQFIF